MNAYVHACLERIDLECMSLRETCLSDTRLCLGLVRKHFSDGNAFLFARGFDDSEAAFVD